MNKVTSLHEIEKLTAGDTQALIELLNVFLKEGTLQIEKLQAYFNEGNLQELKNTAHKIKSSLALIGMNAYRDKAEEIEFHAGKDLQETKQLVLELVIVYNRALTEIKSRLEELP